MTTMTRRRLLILLGAVPAAACRAEKPTPEPARPPAATETVTLTVDGMA
jgi:hypothetical protein